MKKVEIYFLINLGAILSIFAIEGELGEYMRRQDDILLEVAKDKLESMVSIENINSLNSDSLYKFTFNLDGEYEDNSANVEANFTLNDTSASDIQYSVSSKAVEKEGSYVAEIPLSDFDVYQNKRFDVELIIGFKPEISNLTMNNWASVFGSEKIATKIEKNIIKSNILRKMETQIGLSKDSIQFNTDDIYVYKNTKNKAISDPRTTNDVFSSLEQIYQKMKEYTSDLNARITLCPSGGRKSITSAITLAFQLLSRPNDNMVHLMVNNEIMNLPPEDKKKWYYPNDVSDEKQLIEIDKLIKNAKN